jgi:F-type H+-transporting ATPase subunit gamma
MAGAKEIRTKIKSVQGTKKITKAMEMVAASKMRKTGDAMIASRPYATQIKSIADHVAQANPEYKHIYMLEKPVKKVGFIIVSTDRGMCGGLNANLFKKVLSSMQGFDEQNIDTKSYLIGTKAEVFFKRVKTDIISAVSHMGDLPNPYDLIGGIKIMLDAYKNNEIDEIYIAYNKFLNTMTQKPVVEKLLPIIHFDDDSDKLHNFQWDYIYEPDPKEILELLLDRFIETQVYQAVIENIASEQAARMVAMKSASENAGDVINELQLIYNKARQAAITQEISEIVAGAAAVG